jgi:hypothetical protein
MHTPELTIENNQFKITFPYDEYLVMKARQIPGCRWSKPRRAWFFPLSVYVYSSIKANFDGVNIDESTMSILIEAMTPKPIKIVESRTKLYDHQMEAVKTVLERFGFEIKQ